MRSRFFRSHIARVLPWAVLKAEGWWGVKVLISYSRKIGWGPYGCYLYKIPTDSPHSHCTCGFARKTARQCPEWSWGVLHLPWLPANPAWQGKSMLGLWLFIFLDEISEESTADVHQQCLQAAGQNWHLQAFQFAQGTSQKLVVHLGISVVPILQNRIRCWSKYLHKILVNLKRGKWNKGDRHSSITSQVAQSRCQGHFFPC